MQCLAIARASGVRRIFFDGREWKYPEDIETVYQRLAGQFEEFGRPVEAVR
jgi:hypothetical protein